MPEIISAGLMMFSEKNKEIKIFLVHPGGPFFAKKDDGYWGIPKGLADNNEELLDAAKREFKEETGIDPSGDFISLGSVVQKGGKRVYAWAFRTLKDDPIKIECNTFDLEWPPKSGRLQKFPEVDKGEFFNIEDSRKKINQAQKEFIDRLIAHLKV